MAQPKIREESGVRRAREAYFAGEITAEEYLRRALAQAVRRSGGQGPEVTKHSDQQQPQAAHRRGRGTGEVQLRDVDAHQQQSGQRSHGARSSANKARLIGRLWRLLSRLPEAERRRA